MSPNGSGPEWPGSTRLYDLFKGLNASSLARNWRIDGDGLDRLECFQSGIIAANHAHLVDGTVLMPLVRERVLFLCDARAVDAPGLGHLLRRIGVIRVDVQRRDARAAVAATRAALAGHVLGVFPEGRVTGAAGLAPARSGVAYVAARSRLPVLPVAMWGLDAFNRPLDVYVRRSLPVISVRAGEPWAVMADPSDREAVRAARDALMLPIAEMLPPRLRGAYAEGSPHHDSGLRALDRGLVQPVSTRPVFASPSGT